MNDEMWSELFLMNKENIVELKNISVSFDGEKILDGINLDIKDK